MLMSHRRQSVFETTKIRQTTSRNNTRCKVINMTSMKFKKMKGNNYNKQHSVYVKQNNKYEKSMKVNEKLLVGVHDLD